MSGNDKQRSDDYGAICRVICCKVEGLMKDDWTPPFTVDATDRDEEPVFGLEYDGHHYVTAEDMSRLLPDLRFPLTISISDRSGQFLLVEISEDLTVQ
jgi:hypothetical protein